jgi:hypothetical protein
MNKRPIVAGLWLPAVFLLLSLACDAGADIGPTDPGQPAEPPTVAPETPEETYLYDNLPTFDETSLADNRFTAISQWSRLDLTYIFLNGSDALPGDEEHDLVRAAFALWAAETPLTFTEVTSQDEADILIGWASGDHGDGDPFDGPGRVLAHATFPNPYTEGQVDLHFDEDERWVNSESRNVDLLTVAAHEIGHTLGLAHSDDPNALMFAAYQGPRRFLGADDIQGIQALYGIGSVQPPPQAPPPGAEIPAGGGGGGGDYDGDGITDDEEEFVTGTDPRNADSDGDGLDDGTEVYYRMNPLDPDMDRDGVSDGDEVNAGTDPFFPDQQVDSGDDPQLSQDVADFLTQAIELEMEAFREGDPNIAAQIMTGDVLDNLVATIDDLNRQGLVQVSEIDYYRSYIDDIRVVNENRIDVDTCETWSTAVYRLDDSSLVSSSGPDLLPQTIVIEQFQEGWFITGVTFHDAPAFCQG